MIATPTKTESNNNSSSTNKIIFEISENNITTDYNLSQIPPKNIIIPNNIIETSKSNSQIHNAIISDNLEELEKLLKLGENPDILNKSGETPLYVSVDIENYDAMIILLEFGADCNIQKIDGNTALHLATEKKNDIYICSLLSHGANPNIINKTNLQSALHIAIINKINEYVLNKFKENNGDIYNIKDKFNKTPFDYAKNDEKYKNLLISIFSEQNKKNNNKIKCLTDSNKNNSNNSNLDYHNFISLSRKIHLTNEENNVINNNIKENKDMNIYKEKNNIYDINNCLKKHLIFTSNSKDISTEEKNKKLIKSEGSKNSIVEKSSQSGINKNIINVISDKSSNYSNSTNNNINNGNILNNKNNLGDNNINKEINKVSLTTGKKDNNIDKIDEQSLNFILSSPGVNNSINNMKNNKNFNTITNHSNTNGNNSLNSYNIKKEEGISELNPLDIINQMASSNNSNIFSELQINTNKKDFGEGENTSSKHKTEEEFYNQEHNKLNSNEELNNMKENISGNFSSNNNEIYIDENTTKNNFNENEDEENKENLNFINSLDDSLEYSKTKSYIINETSGLLSKEKNDPNENEYSDNIKINNKEESLNIYNPEDNLNSNTDNKEKDNILTNQNLDKIERYKSTTSNKSKKNSDFDSDNKSFNISNISKNNQHHRQLSYHNNKQSSNNKNKTNNNSNINTNIIDNKENIDFNTNDNINIINDGYIIKEEKINKKEFPLYTVVNKQRIYKNENILPEMFKEQKTKDSTIEDYGNNFNYGSNFNKNTDNIIFVNENTNNYNNLYDTNTINTGILDKSNMNQYNTFNSDNNSFKNTKDNNNNYSNKFRKALKKKYLIKEFNTDNIVQKNNNNNKNKIKFPQQISNDLITKLRDWLISCDLLCYYNLLIKNNIYDIESYISNLKNNKINISYKDIEDLGIKKPGHIFRFLLKLQMDIGILDIKICNYIMSKFNENLLTTIAVNSSINEIKYCGMILCPGGAEFSRNLGYNDIFSFLRNKDLVEFKENFIHNGFDQIEFILIQLFSCFCFNKEILNDYLHIYNDNDKIRVIKKLYEEKRNISKEIGINYNEKEVYNILNEEFNINSIEEEEKNKNSCIII